MWQVKVPRPPSAPSTTSSDKREHQVSRVPARAVYCTYPVPLHAHTHFLAAVGPALVLDRVGVQALAAALLLAGLGLAQHVGHALLVRRVQTLRGKYMARVNKSKGRRRRLKLASRAPFWGFAPCVLDGKL